MERKCIKTMIDKYLIGIDFDPFDGIPGIYVVAHHLRGWRYLSTYATGKSKKKEIFEKLANSGMNEPAADWDLHHVVEGNHLAPLFKAFEYSSCYESEWPVVLIHSGEEHKLYNGLFRSAGSSLMLPKAAAESLIKKERPRIEYIDNLYKFYHNVYLGDPVLQKIAHNLIRSLI